GTVPVSHDAVRRARGDPAQAAHRGRRRGRAAGPVREPGPLRPSLVSPEFPPLLDPAELPRRLLVVAPHPDDEVWGCGGLLALHVARGGQVRVLVLTDGASGSGPELAARRERESRAAGAELGVADHVFLGLADGNLGASTELVQRLRDELERFAP